MQITRQLGIQYLWIDSFWIIQDFGYGTDWEHESKLIGNVYRQSFCNIAAAKSTDGNGGCFTSRHVFDVRPCVIEATWSGIPAETNACHYSAHMRDLDHSPLVSRVWIVQETILAPRNLYFGQHQMLWECIQLITCETSFTSPCRNVNKVSLLHKSWQNQRLNLFNVSDLAFIDYHIWAQVVNGFSACYLTYPEKEKYIATSGIAKCLGVALHDTYLAGLWRKPLVHQLGWSRKYVPDLHGYHVRSYRAPSWSWASMDRTAGYPKNIRLWIRTMRYVSYMRGLHRRGKTEMFWACFYWTCSTGGNPGKAYLYTGDRVQESGLVGRREV